MAEREEISSMRIYVQARGSFFQEDGNLEKYYNYTACDIRHFMTETIESVSSHNAPKHIIPTHRCCLNGLLDCERYIVMDLEGDAILKAMKRYGFPIYATIHDGSDTIEAKFEYKPRVENGMPLSDYVHIRQTEEIVRNGVISPTIGMFVSCHTSEMFPNMLAYCRRLTDVK